MSLSLLATSINLTTSSNPLRDASVRPLRVCNVDKRIAHTSCEQKQFKEGDDHVTDRRNVLLGLGGLYGAAATLGGRGMKAIAAPVQPPDLSKCNLAVDLSTKEQVSCCPAYSTGPINVTDFVPPSYKEPLRVRRPAHKLDPEYVAKLKEAIAKMKALPADDPWSYKQQSIVHCTFCNGTYDQVGIDPPVVIQVHGSWLFLPWHRYYLYFFERILGKLIGDPTFALPFWNWDTPEGMRMPKIYQDTTSPLYNDNRDHTHYDAFLDYKYVYGDANPTPAQEEEISVHNLRALHNLFKESILNPVLFMGRPLLAGEVMPANVFGGCETIHNTIHQWTGPSELPYHDMGNFYTAARDTVFFAHHANVDRMWSIYSSFRGNRPEFKDPNFLNASFVFYDENRRVVRCKVRDGLDTQQLRYSYSPEKLPWMDIRRRYKQLKAVNRRKTLESISLEPATEFDSKPRPLTETVRALVKRPKTSRTKDEKEDDVEVLVVEGIEVPQATAARFDVYVTTPIQDLVGPDKGEFAGSFVKIPHTHAQKIHTSGHKSSLQLGITTLLEDIEAESSDKLVVTIVPRMGEVVIEGINIKLSKVDEP